MTLMWGSFQRVASHVLLSLGLVVGLVACNSTSGEPQPDAALHNPDPNSPNAGITEENEAEYIEKLGGLDSKPKKGL